MFARKSRKPYLALFCRPIFFPTASDHIRTLKQKAYAAFQMEYQSFLRATQYSHFDFPLCQALKFISQGEMVKANTVLLPFPQLRPLAIVLGVFRAPMFSSKYNIVIQLWANRFEYSEHALPVPTTVDADGAQTQARRGVRNESIIMSCLHAKNKKMRVESRAVGIHHFVKKTVVANTTNQIPNVLLALLLPSLLLTI
jgi:hypothetical protein